MAITTERLCEVTADSTRELQKYLALMRSLTQILPRRARQQYAEELVSVYESVIVETHEKRGNSAVRLLMLRLLLDLSTAIVQECIDCWRASRCAPAQVAVGSLTIAVLTWSLIFTASFGEIGWATRLLNYSATVTLFMALGLPAVALLSSRVAVAGRSIHSQYAAQIFGCSLIATAVTWSLLVWHIAA
jgi:hypothetical protein